MLGAPSAGFQPGQQPQGFSNGLNRTGPPPAKKSKPIITRYAPPPGYRGPGVPPAPVHAQTWPQMQQPYGYGQPAYPGYPPQTYGQHPQPYPHPGQAYAQPPHAYPPPHQAYPQPQYPGYPNHPGYPGYPGLPGYNPTSFSPQPHFPQQGYTPAGQPQWQTPAHTPPQQWPAPKSERQSSETSVEIKPDLDGMSSANADVKLSHAAQPGQEDQVEEGPYSYTYWHDRAEDVPEDLRMDQYTWHAPLPAKYPLPATFAEAELEAIAPRKALPSDDEAISSYYINEKRHNTLLSVRQEERWDELKDSLIFKEFPAVCQETLPMSELLEKYRDRHDPEWEPREPSESPEPEDLPTYATSKQGGDGTDSAIVTNGEHSPQSNMEIEETSNETDVLGNLEQALQTNGRMHSGRHSRRPSTISNSGYDSTRPKPIMPIRDEDQEAILATLGVTGSPQMLYQTPGPAFGASQPQHGRRPSQQSGHGRPNSSHGMHGAAYGRPPSQKGWSRPSSAQGMRGAPQGHPPPSKGPSRPTSSNEMRGAPQGGPQGRHLPPPPPPPPPGRPPSHHRESSLDPWRTNGQSSWHDRRGSGSSHHTAPGSDFAADEDHDMTPRPRSRGGADGTRKRSFDQTDAGERGSLEERDDDATPRPRYKAPRVDDAYKRRW